MLPCRLHQANHRLLGQALHEQLPITTLHYTAHLHEHPNTPHCCTASPLPLLNHMGVWDNLPPPTALCILTDTVLQLLHQVSSTAPLPQPQSLCNVQSPSAPCAALPCSLGRSAGVHRPLVRQPGLQHYAGKLKSYMFKPSWGSCPSYWVMRLKYKEIHSSSSI